MLHDLRSSLLVAGVVTLASACAGIGIAPLPAGRSAVLPQSVAAAVVRQCSRPAPGAIDGTWLPDAATVAELDRRMPEVARMTAACCIRGLRLRSIADSYVQYAGIVRNGRRYIYVNGFREENPPADWRERPVMTCDGGSFFWGVLYDPQTGRFSEFAVNGQG